MNTYQVDSIPLKEVIESLADSFKVGVRENCDEVSLKIPADIGTGQIRGINFGNGLGLIIYVCEFRENTQIEFTKSDIHPVKFLYTRQGPITHFFANLLDKHTILQYECAIIASDNKNGHILRFEKNTAIELVSLEINRKKFKAHAACEMKDLPSKLRRLLEDSKAENRFYHNGVYDLAFKNILSDIGKYEDHQLIREFYLESMALRIFINQLLLFEDDQLNDESRKLLRVNELSRAEDLSGYIRDHLNNDLNIPQLCKKSGLNPIKLQTAFKYLYNNTVTGYITDKRLERAEILIKTTDLNISQIAYHIGYTSLSYFSKIYKEKYGISPSKYKKIHS